MCSVYVSLTMFHVFMLYVFISLFPTRSTRSPRVWRASLSSARVSDHITPSVLQIGTAGLHLQQTVTDTATTDTATTVTVSTVTVTATTDNRHREARRSFTSARTVPKSTQPPSRYTATSTRTPAQTWRPALSAAKLPTGLTTSSPISGTVTRNASDWKICPNSVERVCAPPPRAISGKTKIECTCAHEMHICYRGDATFARACSPMTCT